MAITHDQVVQKLKRVAKKLRQDTPSLTQAKALDQVAAMLGFNNWSLLSKEVHRMAALDLAVFHQGLYGHPPLADLLPPEFPGVNEKVAREEMKSWVEANFSPLINFAFYDNESENGFAWADEDINMALQEEFDQTYPFDLIESVAMELEMDGPWGIEDYGRDDD